SDSSAAIALRMRDLYSRGSKCSATAPISSAGQTDRRDLASVIVMPAVGGTAIAEEAFFVAIGADRKIDNSGKSSLREAAGEIARQVEHVVTGTAGGGEEFRIAAVIVGEAFEQFGTYLVNGSRDRRSDHRGDARTLGA